MKRFALFLIGLLMLCSMEAKQKVSQATFDSLYNVGVRMAEQGKFERSNSYFDALPKVYKMSLVQKFEIYGRMAINYNLMGDYRMMYKYLRKIYDKEKIANLLPLSILPKDTLERPYQDVTIAYRIDTLYTNDVFGGCEISIPVEIGGRKEMMVIDNGMAKYSTVNETFAREHGIRPIGYEGATNGVIDESKMWLGILDSLKVGKLLFRNLVFTVVPDDNITNTSLPFNAFLGANFFRLAGEMDFDNSKRTITFPFIQRYHEPNVRINSIGEHFVNMELNGDLLEFHFDLGYSITALTSNYYDRYRQEVERTCRASAATISGIGGTSTVIVHYMRNPRLYFNGTVFTPKNLLINSVKDHNEGDEYGKLGNDFLLSYRHVILNLRKMFMEVE